MFINFRQSLAYAQYMQSLGWLTPSYESHHHQWHAFIKPIPGLFCAVMKVQRIPANVIDFDWIHHLERRHHVYKTHIELAEMSTSVNKFPQLASPWKQSNDYLLVSKTRIIDLRLSANAILAAMKPKTRYNIHLAAKHRLICQTYTGNQIATDPSLSFKFHQIIAANAKRIGMYLIPWHWIVNLYRYFGNDAWIMAVTLPHSDTWIAASLFIKTNDALFYHFNGSTEIGRKTMAPTFIIWQAIQKAQADGCRWFDFEGVFDERHPKQARFKGFTTFKSKFGGQEVYFPPMYIKYRLPWQLS